MTKPSNGLCFHLLIWHRDPYSVPSSSADPERHEGIYKPTIYLRIQSDFRLFRDDVLENVLQKFWYLRVCPPNRPRNRSQQRSLLTVQALAYLGHQMVALVWILPDKQLHWEKTDVRTGVYSCVLEPNLQTDFLGILTYLDPLFWTLFSAFTPCYSKCSYSTYGVSYCEGEQVSQGCRLHFS